MFFMCENRPVKLFACVAFTDLIDGALEAHSRLALNVERPDV